MQLHELIAGSPVERAGLIASGQVDVAQLLAASAAFAVASPAVEPVVIATFLPSLNQVPPAVVAASGPDGALLAELGLRRLWQIGAQVYQPLAMRVAWPGGHPEQPIELLVRRKHTAEPVALATTGSPLAALLRALDPLGYLRREGPGKAVLAELGRRSLQAGLPAVSEVRQALVVATPAVLADQRDLAAVLALRAQLEPGPLGFRFLEVHGRGDELRLQTASGPWEAASLVRAI